MKLKFAFLVSFFVASVSWAQPSSQSIANSCGLPTGCAATIAAIPAGLSQNTNPTATNTYSLGTSALRWLSVFAKDVNLPTGVITPAATPVSTFAPVAAVATAAANAGGLLPVITPGMSRQICNLNSANAITVWPQAAASTPGVILGFNTPVAAGTPASLAAGKCINCRGFNDATVINTWLCQMGA